MEKMSLNIRIHRDITGEVWIWEGLTLTLKVVQITGASHSNLHKSVNQKDALANKLPLIESSTPNSEKTGNKVKSESVQKLRSDKIYMRKDSRFYHLHWYKEISGIHYDSLIKFSSANDARNYGGLHVNHVIHSNVVTNLTY